MQTALFTYIGRKTITLEQNACGRATPFFHHYPICFTISLLTPKCEVFSLLWLSSTHEGEA